MTLGAVCVLAAVSLVGSAGAAPTTDTTAVSFVDVPAKQIWGNNSVNPGKAESVVVIGGTTTVPTNATTVRLEVTVKGGADGTLKFYPAGNEAGGAGHTLSWSAGGTNTGVTAENVGMQNKVSVFNTSTKAAVVTIKVTGYSTQVTAGDINGSGGTAGQVLTNNGSGGATWKVPSPAFANHVTNGFGLGFTNQVMRTLNVPAGSYHITGSGFAVSQATTTPATIQCSLHSPTDQVVGQSVWASSANWDIYTPVSVHGLLTTSGGTVQLKCGGVNGANAVFWYPNLTAVAVGSVSGTITSARTKATPVAKTLPRPNQQ